MESIDIKNKENLYKDFELMDSFRIVIYSVIGIFILFVPININGYTNTILYHMYQFIQVKYTELIKLYIFLMVVIGSIMPILKDKNKNDDIFNNIIRCIKPISILFIFIIFSRKEYRLYNNDSLLFMQDMLLKSVVLFSLSSIFMPLITDYGLLDIVEAYSHKYMKKTFKLSGKCVLNIMVYLFIDVFSGMFMTNKLYKKGKLRHSEACILVSCFSFMSIINCFYIADELKLESKVFTIVMSIFLSLFVNYLVCRVWPLKDKKKSYLNKTSYKENNFKKDKFKNAVRKYLSNKENNKLFSLIIENFKESFNIIMTILPNLVIIIFIGEFLINNTGLVDTISQTIHPIIELLKLPNKAQISEFICVSMFDKSRYIEFINNDIANIPILIIFIISIAQTISLTTNMIFISSTDIPLKKVELIIIGIEKFLITLTIISLVYYLIIGYL
jgi:nucleoside recognition membrane protein YjiH